MKILDDIFDGTNFNLVDGEIQCQATKEIAKEQERLFGNKIPLNKGFGRRIDLILSAKGIELSSSEWKKMKISLSKSLQQQAKNLRTNKAILSNLLKQPISQEDAANVFVVGMDWTGPLGYMFSVNSFDDIYISNRLCTLTMPIYLHEFSDFIDMGATQLEPTFSEPKFCTF